MGKIDVTIEIFNFVDISAEKYSFGLCTNKHGCNDFLQFQIVLLHY